MAFFTSDIKVAETFANPQVQQVIGPGAGRAWSGDMGSAQGMLSELGRSTQQGSGAFNYNIPSAQQLWSQVSVGSGVTPSMLGGGVGTVGTGDSGLIDASTQPISELPEDFIPPKLQPMPRTFDDTSGLFDMTTHSGVGASEFDVRDYLENRGMYQFGAGLLGTMTGGLPLGSLLDYKAGINPLSHIGPFQIGPTFLDHFGELAGITSEQLGGVEWSDLPSGEQRDMLVEQLMFDERGEGDEDRTWSETLSDWWDDLTSSDYDPDMDLTADGWMSDGGEVGSSDYDADNYSDWTEEEFESDFGWDDSDDDDDDDSWGDWGDWGDDDGGWGW